MDRTWVLVESFFASPITWGVVTLLAIALALSGKLNMSAATGVLWLAFFTALFGVYRAEAILKTDTLMRYLVLGCCAFGFAAGTVLLNRWMTSPKAPEISTSSQPPEAQEHLEHGPSKPDSPIATVKPTDKAKAEPKHFPPASTGASKEQQKPAPKKDETPPAQQPAFSVTNPTGSIVNQGSSVTAPQTVNNFGPPELAMSDAQRSQVTDYLTIKANLSPLKIHIFVDGPTTSTQQFGEQLRRALVEAGADVDKQEGMFLPVQGDPVYPGISFDCVTAANQEKANAIGLALLNAKIIDKPVQTLGKRLEDGGINIIIRKP